MDNHYYTTFPSFCLHSVYEQERLSSLWFYQPPLIDNLFQGCCIDWGQDDTYFLVAFLTPCLDIIRIRITSPTHLWICWCIKASSWFLTNVILAADGQRSYTSQLQSFSFPSGWIDGNLPLILSIAIAFKNTQGHRQQPQWCFAVGKLAGKRTLKFPFTIPRSRTPSSNLTPSTQTGENPLATCRW